MRLFSMVRLAVFVLGAAGAFCASGASAPQFRSVGDEPAVLYDAPSAKSKRMFVLGPGYPLEVLVALEGWIKVRDAGATIGWIEAKALTPKRNVVVRSNAAEVRATADRSAKVAFKVERGVMLEWLENVPGGWVRVRHAEAGQGFVQSSDLWGS